MTQNCDPRTLKIYSKQCSLNFKSEKNPANPFTLQVSSQLVTRGAGGRGEAFRIRRAGAKLQLHGVLRLALLSPSPVHIHVQSLYILCVKTQELTLVSSF